MDAGWRGAYDLLVLPPDAATLPISGKQVVPSDFLAVRSSGITRTQWQAVEQVPGVEVAAPLASLGWVRPDAVNLTVQFATPNAGQLIRIDTTIQSPDGSLERDSGYFGLNYDNPERPPIAVDTFHSRGWDTSIASVGLWTTLPMAWGDVVGIDPIEEDRLIGLDGYVAGETLQRGLTTTFDQGYQHSAVRVPVLTPAQENVNGQVTITISTISSVDISSIAAALKDPPSALTNRADALAWANDLIEQQTAGATSTVVSSRSSDLQNLVQPLRETLVTFVNGMFQTGTTGSASSSGRNVVLLSGSTPYRLDDQGRVSLDSLGTWGDLVEPVIDAAQPSNFVQPPMSLNDMLQYRPLTVTVPDPFLVNALGTYDLRAITSRYAAATNYVPLGIYGEPTRQLVADAAGNPATQEVPVSLNPGGLNPLPPIGLTNLETVEALRGPQFIDAIRVRVADISSYTPGAVDRIAQVAQAIRDRTGLHVDVVAGSSPVDVNVDVQGVGTVREQWTTLGEAPRIVTGAEGLSGLLLGGAGLVMLLYLGSFGVFLVDDQRRGLEVLRQIGWRRMSRIWLLVGQALLLGTASAILAVCLLAVFDATTEVNLPVIAYPIAALAVIGAHVAAAGLAALTGRRGRQRNVVEPARWLSLGVVRLGVRNSLETPRRLLTVAIALALSIAVAGTIAAVEVAYGGELRTSVLGGLVWLRVGWYHLLAAGAALFAAASIALDSGVLAVERRVSLIALLRATGWRARAITGVVAVEVGLPAVVGGLLAVIPVIGVGAWVGLGWPVLVVFGGAALVLGALIALVVAVLPARLALAVDPARGLAAEGMTGALPGFALRAALATIVVLALFVSGAGIGYGVIAPAAIPADAFAPVPSAPPPTATELALTAHVQAIAAHSDRASGSASLDWTFSYVTDFLTANGGQTSRQEFVSDQATWFAAGGAEVDVKGLFSREVAVAPGFAPTSPQPFTLVTGSQPPCAPGIMILRVSDADPATLPADTLSRCTAAGTTAVLAVRPVNEDAWSALSGAASVELTAGRILWATIGGPVGSTPLVVVPVGSTGPGAAQSAAPVAVALELAARANAATIPLRLAFADLGQVDPTPVLVRRIAETMPAAPVIELGPLGGRLAAVLGVHWADPLDEGSTRQALLGSVVADDGAAAWVARTTHLTATDTSAGLLDAVAAGTPPIDMSVEGVVAPSALAVGIDAAYLGEPLSNETATGTPADEADQIDLSALLHALNQLTSALEVLDGQ